MNVLMTSTSFPRDPSDWKGVFILHMAAALARTDFVNLRLWAPPGELPEHVMSVSTPPEAARLARLMEKGGISHLMRKRKVTGAREAFALLRMLAGVYRRSTDISLYHVNWLQCALPLPNDGKPVLITVLGNDMQLARKPPVKWALRRAMRGHKVAICPNANWMEQPLRAAFGDIAEVVPVPFGIDPDWYAIQRHVEELPHIWLAVTRLTAAKLGPLFEWSQPLFANSGRELHLFGPRQEDVDVPPWVHYHGSATAVQLSKEWFPRATGLITLSRHAEGRPQVMLEAMAAGLPIVASRMPAHADIVNDRVTGALCDSPESYQQALTALEDRSTNLRMGQSARAWIERELGTWDDCAARYVQIYRRLLGPSEHG
jgi:glycosyltransferase involved in cell wall biosynthesis